MEYKTILADPPWDHECWADTGKLKHPGNHYAKGDNGKSVMTFSENGKMERYNADGSQHYRTCGKGLTGYEADE